MRPLSRWAGSMAQKWRHGTEQGARPCRRSTKAGSTSWRCAMSGASRRPARSCATISRASCANAAGTAPREPDLARDRRSLRRAGLYRRRGLCAEQIARDGRARLRQTAAARDAARRRGRGGAMARQRASMPTRKRWQPHCASPSGGGSVRSRESGARPAANARRRSRRWSAPATVSPWRGRSSRWPPGARST